MFFLLEIDCNKLLLEAVKNYKNLLSKIKNMLLLIFRVFIVSIPQNNLEHYF